MIGALDFLGKICCPHGPDPGPKTVPHRTWVQPMVGHKGKAEEEEARDYVREITKMYLFFLK